MIQLHRVGLTLNHRELLKEVSIDVSRGATLGIIGRSGSGKSLILKIMSGLIEPTSGSVTRQSERLSMLFQRNALFDSLTALENVMLPMTETLGREPKASKTRALELLEAVGLLSSASLRPDELSGGMQKRLGIARTLAIEPEVILYDEPTAGLDPITSKTIAELILALQLKDKTTLVMVTNDLQRAYQTCSQIGYCSEGTFRMCGSPTEIQNTKDPEIWNFIYGKTEHNEHPV